MACRWMYDFPGSRCRDSVQAGLRIEMAISSGADYGPVKTFAPPPFFPLRPTALVGGC